MKEEDITQVQQEEKVKKKEGVEKIKAKVKGNNLFKFFYALN